MGDRRDSEGLILQRLSLAKKPVSLVLARLENGQVENGYIAGYSRKAGILILSPDLTAIDSRLSFEEHAKNKAFRQVEVKYIVSLDIFPSGPGTIVPHRQEPPPKQKKK